MTTDDLHRSLAVLNRVRREQPPRRSYGRGGRPIEHQGEVRTIAGWARHLGMNPRTLAIRIRRWGIERALTTPPKRYDKSLRPDVEILSALGLLVELQDESGRSGTISRYRSDQVVAVDPPSA